MVRTRCPSWKTLLERERNVLANTDGQMQTLHSSLDIGYIGLETMVHDNPMNGTTAYNNSVCFALFVPTTSFGDKFDFTCLLGRVYYLAYLQSMGSKLETQVVFFGVLNVLSRFSLVSSCLSTYVSNSRFVETLLVGTLLPRDSPVKNNLASMYSLSLRHVHLA